MWDRRHFLKTAAVLAAASCAGGHSSLFGADPNAYTVRRGDTLSSIAQRFGLTVDELRSRNNLRGDRILVGQSLIVGAPAAPAITYTVRSGDTLGKIASAHNTSVGALRSANKISGDTIHPGQQLSIPPSGRSDSHRYIAEVVRVTQGLRVRQRPWRYIVGHHSGINKGNAAIYDRFHRRRMPNGLAYHFVIGNGTDSGNGHIEIGDRWRKQLQGGHVRTHAINDVGIGICLVGNFEERRPTPQQIAAFTELVQYLKYSLLGGNCQFTVHREIDGNHTLCPGRLFPTAQMHQRFS